MEKLSDLLSMNGEREVKEIQKKQCRIYTIVYRESKRFITQIKKMRFWMTLQMKHVTPYLKFKKRFEKAW